MAQESKGRFRGTLATAGAAPTPINWLLEDGTIVTELPFPVNAASIVRVNALAVSSAGVVKAWAVIAAIKRGAAAVSAVGVPVPDVFADAGAAAWTLGPVPTATGFRFDAVGAIGVNIDWRIELESNLFQP